jgi:beta-lactamase class C
LGILSIDAPAEPNDGARMKPSIVKIFFAVFLVCASLAPKSVLAEEPNANIEKIVAQSIRPLMAQFAIPGMSVGIVVDAHSYIFNYGLASKATQKLVADDTLFEIGSVSKTFTAALASYAQIKGHLSLSDPTSKYLPILSGSPFGKVSLINLGTHTTGGLPLQVPDEVTNDDQLMAFFQNWKPTYAPGTYRTYANPSIGLLGLITAKSMNEDFEGLMERTVFRGLGLSHTYYEVPEAQAQNYAQGYTKEDKPIRMAPGELASQAYGIRTNATDLLGFLKANMQMIDIDKDLKQAILQTHTGYYRLGAMTQDLIWEQYRYPVDLADLLEGNSSKVSYEANPVSKLEPASAPRSEVLLNKTGSTNGFGAYVAFVPAKHMGIVLLANKNYPNDARVRAAYQILTQLGMSASR